MKNCFSNHNPLSPLISGKDSPMLLFFSLKHTKCGYKQQKTECIQTQNVPPSRHDMALCPLEIPRDVNPTPASEPISKYTHRPAHGNIRKLTDTPILPLSLSLARSPTTDTPTFLSSQYHLFPVFSLSLVISLFLCTFKDVYGHIWALIRGNTDVLKTNEPYGCPMSEHVSLSQCAKNSSCVCKCIDRVMTAGNY